MSENKKINSKKQKSVNVKINNDKKNLNEIHNKLFNLDEIKFGNKSVLLIDMGNPYHYIKLKEQNPNLKIYGIENYKLEPTFRYCQNTLNCFIEFYKDESSKNEWIRCITKHIKKNSKMKFDITIGNPPFEGSGDPLFMKVIKIIYDNYLSEDGLIRAIHPTTLVDNKFDLVVYKKYKDLKLLSFDFSNELRDIFNGADIGNGIGVFTYSKKGKYTLFDDELKIIRFGDEYCKDKEIVEQILSKCQQTIWDYPNFTHINTQNKKTKVDELNSKYDIFVSFARNRGHINKKNNGLKWDWTTLQCEKYLKVLDKLDYIGQNVLPVKSKEEGIQYIKWSSTDFVNYLVLHFKTNLTNGKNLFKRIPQPISSGDFSDESIMETFGLSKEQMSHIHEKVKNFGMKISYKCSEEELLNMIERINQEVEENKKLI